MPNYIKATDCCGEYLLAMMRYYDLISMDTLLSTAGASSSFVSYGDLMNL